MCACWSLLYVGNTRQTVAAGYEPSIAEVDWLLDQLETQG
jgi:hypothetical protein